MLPHQPPPLPDRLTHHTLPPPNLTQFCFCCELCLLRCFSYLGTVLPTLTPCIVHHLTLHFRIASQNPSLHFRNPFELPQNHHRFLATTILTFAFGDFEFAVFPFPKVFRLIRNGSTSTTPPLIIDTDGNLDDIIVYSPRS